MTLLLVYIIFTFGFLVGGIIAYFSFKDFSKQQVNFLQGKLDNANKIIKNLDQILYDKSNVVTK